jgi:large subunit ribosomal protein L18
MIKNQNKLKVARRSRRRRGIRKRLFGTPQRPRLTVFRSQKHIYAQLIDDVSGRTLAAAASSGQDKGSDVESARQVGAALADKAKAAGVQTVSFDRSGYRYHGRVKALADAARQGGLKF